MSRLMEDKRRIAGESLGGRVRAFLTGVYPVVKLLLGVTGAIAEVSIESHLAWVSDCI